MAGLDLRLTKAAFWGGKQFDKYWGARPNLIEEE